MWNQLDEDGDGQVTLADIHRVSDNDNVAPLGEDLAEDQQRFTEADWNGDGFLDFDELLAAMRGS